MGTNSNRSRTRCKQDGCNELTRSNSGLCRSHMATPAEAVILRPAMDKTIGVQGSWSSRGPLTWRAGVVARERLAQTATLPAEATQATTPTNDRTETDSASGCGHAGIVVATADAPVTVHPGRFDFSDIAGLAGIGAVLVLLWLACECAR